VEFASGAQWPRGYATRARKSRLRPRRDVDHDQVDRMAEPTRPEQVRAVGTAFENAMPLPGAHRPHGAPDKNDRHQDHRDGGPANAMFDAVMQWVSAA